MAKISIIIPSYNEAEQIPLTIEQITRYIPTEYDFELLFIDDGSTDASWQILSAAALSNPRVRALRFSRNFGKESALVAGLTQATGDAVIVMDCDLQHPPSYIPTMLKLWEEGYEIVEGVKASRGKESSFSRFSAKLFYKLFAWASSLDLENASDFKLLDRRVVAVWEHLPERELFFRGLAAWVGFKRCSFTFEVAERQQGTSKWSLRSLCHLSLNAITGFSARPLLSIAAVGLILVLLFLILGVQTLYHWLQGNAASGFTTVILLQLLIGGSVLISLGLIGSYIGRIYDESKQRPRWLIAEQTTSPKQNSAEGSDEL